MEWVFHSRLYAAADFVGRHEVQKLSLKKVANDM